jgi:hypothetical protein
MWKLLCQSVLGTSHERSGQPCQDYCSAAGIPLPGAPAMILVCADGAGSAEHSDLGARLACETLVNAISQWLHANGALSLVLETQAAQWVQPVHDRLVAEADKLGVPPRQLACTLLFAVLHSGGAVFGQIGDGAIVARKGDTYEHLLWPRAGEYANTTFFITDPKFAANLHCVWCNTPPEEVALFTDGLQSLALDFHKHQAHGPFFAPMFQALAAADEPGTLLGPLVDFLRSPAVTERTDDDKTLILATQRAI